MKNNISSINISDIELDTAQPRQELKAKPLEDLAKDIEERGMLYPILVAPFYKEKDVLFVGKNALNSQKRKWWVLDGERRIRIMKMKHQKTIEAIIKTDLTFCEMLEIQFASNCKRVQVTVEEMAKAVKRFKSEYKKQFPKKNPIERLVELTGYSHTYFDMAEAINRADQRLQKGIFDGRVGGYTAFEIEKATKDTAIRKGIVNAYVNTKRPFSALVPRTLKHEFRRIERKNITPTQKEKLTESVVHDFVFNKSGTDVKPDFLRYKHETETFLERVNQWNLIGLKMGEISELIALIEAIKNVFLERRREIGKLKTKRKSRNIKK